MQALRSLRRWMNALATLPRWPNPKIQNVTYAAVDGECPGAPYEISNVFKINFYGTQQDFVNSVCKADGKFFQMQDSLLCGLNRGYSVTPVGFPVVLMSPLQADHVRAFYEESSMHELGHTLGLADTHKVGTTYVGHMALGMMRYSGGVELYPDDLLGLQAAWKYAKTSEAACDGSQRSGTPDYLFCDPSASAAAGALKFHADVEKLAQKASDTTQAAASVVSGANSGGGGAGAASGESGALLEVTSAGAKVVLSVHTETKFKDSDLDSATGFVQNVCPVPRGATYKRVVKEYHASSKHVQIQFEPPLQGCPEGLNTQAWVYLGHGALTLQALTGP